MASIKVQFPNEEGVMLAARLELPVNQHPHTYALFAHCFTCSKNLSAIRHISSALHLSGVAVLRFDFTGLGESEGDFADTNFSSNVSDLVSAARYLATHYEAPSLLVGHSLGGAAVLCAAGYLPSVKAVATIGAPFDPAHVSHLLEPSINEIEAKGVAEVNIGGRPFLVKQQFLEDIRSNKLSDKINRLGKALLIMHAPQDLTVPIENAANLYQTARHPKSFISLDGADHLLSDRMDAQYVGDCIACWVKRYLALPSQEKLRSDKAVSVRLGEVGFTTEIMVRQHSLKADEPEAVGGNDFGPSPYELVTAGLGACTAMTLQMYARRKQWDLKEVRVHLEHYKDYTSDMADAEKGQPKIDYFDRNVELVGNLTEEQRQRLLAIANKCPVHRTLHQEVEVKTKLV
ncbi:MAG: bifunctional alpha/beta hydrolase/OsmC family protein [Saprospiraceae bacterium]